MFTKSPNDMGLYTMKSYFGFFDMSWGTIFTYSSPKFPMSRLTSPIPHSFMMWGFTISIVEDHPESVTHWTFIPLNLFWFSGTFHFSPAFGPLFLSAAKSLTPDFSIEPATTAPAVVIPAFFRKSRRLIVFLFSSSISVKPPLPL